MIKRFISLIISAALLTTSFFSQGSIAFAAQTSFFKFTSGEFGNALNMPLGDDRGDPTIVIPSRTTYETSEWTVQLWIKMNTDTNNNVIVSHGAKGVGHWELYKNPDGYISYYAPDISPADINSSIKVDDGNWHFISFAYKANDHVRVKVDNMMAIDQTITGSISTSSAKDMALGSLPTSNLSVHDDIIRLNGAIDDVHLMNISTVHSSIPTSAAAVGANTLGLWSLDGFDSNGNISDLSSESNSAVVTYYADTRVSDIALSTSTNKVEIANNGQKWVFLKDGLGKFKLKTYVWDGTGYGTMFNGERPLLSGSSFDLYPTSYQITEDSSSRKAVTFSGIHPSLGYNWTALVEAKTGSKLITITITCVIPQGGLNIPTPQPTVALWMTDKKPDLIIDQGPSSIYGDNNFGNVLPAAYMWTEQKEAAFFLDLTPMTWMNQYTLNKFLNVRVQAINSSNYIGLGMYPRSQSGFTIPQGDMVVKYSLYADYRPEKPTKLQAQETMTNTFAKLLPSTATIPTDRHTSSQSTWTNFNAQTRTELQDSSINAVVPLYKWTGTWTDPILSNNTLSSLNMSGRFYDYSTTNNFLAPWIGILRYDPNTTEQNFIQPKVKQLQMFYDPKVDLITYGTRINSSVGSLHMPWQNFQFPLMTMLSYDMLPSGDFNPALAGNFIDSLGGLMKLAHNVDYVFPQWFNSYTMEPAIQNDVPELGVVYEPYQAGIYSYLMLLGNKVTGNSIYLDEAKESIKHLMTDMEYTVDNQVYKKAYEDPTDFTITELFGHAYGAAAAQRVYNETSNADYLGYSQNFIDGLLKLTSWYNDEGDEKARSINNYGLFFPHGGAFNACPWESVDAVVPLTVPMKYNSSLAQKETLLKIYNLQRADMFHFYPAAWSSVLSSDFAYNNPFQYMPLEPFYISGIGGFNCPPASYMSNAGLWCYLLYEAVGKANDSDVMVLNLDVMDNFEYSADSLERNLIVYNGTASTKSDVKVVMKSLADDTYNVTVTNSDGTTYSTASNITDDDLKDVNSTNCVTVNLNPGEYKNIKITDSTDYSTNKASIDQDEEAKDKLSYAYRLTRKMEQDYTRNLLANDLGNNVMEQIGGYLSVLTNFDRAVMLKTYALDSGNGIYDVAGFLEEKFCSDWQPDSTWLNNYNLQSNPQLPQSYLDRTSMLATAVSQYSSQQYASAIATANSILSSINSSAVLEKLTLTSHNKSLIPGETGILSLRGDLTDEKPANLAAGTVAYSSDNTSVVTVDNSTGVFTALASGKANISAKVNLGGITKIASIPVTVLKNYAENKTATADSVIYSASNSVDGQWSTQDSDAWVSTGSSENHWLKVDLGAQKTINRFVVKHVGDSRYNTKDYKIQGSNNDSTWTDLVTVTGNTLNETSNIIAPQEYRYIRLNITNPSAYDFYARIFEFQVYGEETGGFYVNFASGASETAVEADSTLTDAYYPEGYFAKNAFDGRLDWSNGAWCSTSTSTSHWLKVDVGTEKQVSKFVIRHFAYDNNLITKDFKIQGSDDGSNWADLVTVVDNTSVTTSHILTSDASNRYYRLYITTPTQNTDTFARILEFEVLGNMNPVASGVGVKSYDLLDTVSVTKEAYVRQELQGYYTFNNAASHAEGTSTYRWLVSDTENGTYTPISGATSKNFTLTSNEANNYIKFEVTPIEENGLAGVATQSSPVLVMYTTTIDCTQSPTITTDTYFYWGQPSLARDGNLRTGWLSTYDSPIHWFKMDFRGPQLLKRIVLSQGSRDYTIQGSNDDSTWTDLVTVVNNKSGFNVYDIASTTEYRYYRLYITDGGSTDCAGITEMQLFGTRVYSSGIDLAYGATTTSDANYSVDYNSSKAVDGELGSLWASGGTVPHWLKVDIGQSKTVSQIIIRHTADPNYSTKDYVLKGSNDDVNWTDLVTVTNNNQEVTTHDITPALYRYIKMDISNAGIDGCARIFDFKLMGDDKTNLVNYAAIVPEGSVLTDSTYFDSINTDNYYAKKASDGKIKVSDGIWLSTNSNATHWLRIDLGSQNQSITDFIVRHYPSSSLVTKDFVIQGSNDDSTWIDLATVTGNTSFDTLHTLSSAVSYRYYRLYITSPSQNTDQYARIREFEVLGN